MVQAKNKKIKDEPLTYKYQSKLPLSIFDEISQEYMSAQTLD